MRVLLDVLMNIKMHIEGNPLSFTYVGSSFTLVDLNNVIDFYFDEQKICNT